MRPLLGQMTVAVELVRREVRAQRHCRHGGTM